MLSRLKVSNYAIIEGVDVEFASGLNVLTGETGSGKSVLTRALGFVLGERESGAVVRDGEHEAEVTAYFGEKELRRTITTSGRSRAWIDGESVTLAELKELGATLVDIHGPSASQKLLEERFQRETLDGFYAPCGKAAREYSVAWKEFSAARDELSKLEGAEYDEDALDLLRFQVEELEAAGIDSDDDDLDERHKAAAHAGEIVENAGEITEAIGGDRGAAEILIQLQGKFASIAKHMPEAEEWAQTAEDVTRRLQELSRTIADAATKIDVDEREFDRLDERLGVVNKLRRKYLKSGFGENETLSEAMGKILEAKKTKLAAMENRDAAIAEAKMRLAQSEVSAKGLALELANTRRESAKKISQSVTKALKDLGFLQSRFSVEVSDTEELAPSGMDRVRFMFEPNPGESARELSDIASSGETARVMLAIKGVLAKDKRGETLVFDEIDANIGGETGRKVGERLKKLSVGGQVIAITHLPQSAAYGEKHFAVWKSVEDGRTKSHVAEVEGKARVKELARMFGAEEGEKAAWAHAEEILKKVD